MTTSVQYISCTGLAAQDLTMPYFLDAGIVIKLQNGRDRSPRDVHAEGEAN